MHDSATEPAALDPEGGGFVRVRLDVAYDGTDFYGFANQPNLRTVQGVLEEALARVLRIPSVLPTVCAGRTDAGVHARGQVVQADLPVDIWRVTVPATLLRRLAGALPRDVRVHAVAEAPPGFDARFSPLWRRYTYRVCDDQAGPDPLRRHEVLWDLPRPLDVDALNAAAEVLIGQHDFASFCRKRPGATTIRTLDHFRWERTAPALVEASVIADAFCHSMVRSMVGACLAVGEGRRDLDWIVRLLAARARSSELQVARPEGLTLEQVKYPPDAEMGARAELTRNRRG